MIYHVAIWEKKGKIFSLGALSAPFPFPLSISVLEVCLVRWFSGKTLRKNGMKQTFQYKYSSSPRFLTLLLLSIQEVSRCLITTKYGSLAAALGF